jgi:hypothetical protein
MYLTPDKNCRTARDVRAHFSQVCKADHATIVLDFNQPAAIITPVDGKLIWEPGPKNKKIAAARKRFLAALDLLRTHNQD